MTTLSDIMTAEELLNLPIDRPCELVKGRLHMMTPAGHWHGEVELRIGRLIGNYVEEKGLGTAYGAETGFQIGRKPDTVLAPDAAFVLKNRAPKSRRGFFQGAPDLAVEVVSPSDSEAAVDRKARTWLDAGARAVWVVWPERRAITVYQAGEELRELRDGDTLAGGDVLPGFVCAVTEVLGPLDE